jgi:hypothetical protein
MVEIIKTIKSGHIEIENVKFFTKAVLNTFTKDD